jgi:hypothetical protein
MRQKLETVLAIFALLVVSVMFSLSCWSLNRAVQVQARGLSRVSDSLCVGGYMANADAARACALVEGQGALLAQFIQTQQTIIAIVALAFGGFGLYAVRYTSRLIDAAVVGMADEVTARATRSLMQGEIGNLRDVVDGLVQLREAEASGSDYDKASALTKASSRPVAALMGLWCRMLVNRRLPKTDRRFALKALESFCGKPEATSAANYLAESLYRLLEEGDRAYTLHREAIEVLNRLGEPTEIVRQVLAKLATEHISDAVRSEAARTLARMPDVGA